MGDDRLAREVATLGSRLEALEGLIKALLMDGGLPVAPSGRPRASAGGGPRGRHLVARCADRLLGLPLDQVQHVTRNAALAVVPGASRALAGILDLRGTPVEVVGLRAALGAPRLDDDLDCRIVLLSLEGRVIGLLVDEVLGVEVVEAARLHPAPELQGTGYVTGVLAAAGWANELIVLLEPAALLATLRRGDALELEPGSGEDEAPGA